MQFVLRVVGIAALVVAALFAVLAVHYYLTQHIRAVMDDLSGKARARGVARARRNVAAGNRGAGRTARPAMPEPTSAPRATQAPEPVMPFAEAAPAAPVADEGGSGTMVAEAFSAPAPVVAPVDEDDLATEVAGDAAFAEDDLATMVESAGYDEDDLATMVEAVPASEDDLPTMVEAAAPADEDDLPTMVEAADGIADEDDLPTMVEAAPASDAVELPVPAVVAPVASSRPEDVSSAPFQMTKRIVLIHAQDVIAGSEESLA